jgi:hypothetical protein
MSRPSSNDTTSLMGACNTALKLPMYRPRPPFRHRGLALNAQAACCGHGPVSARSGAILGSNDLEAEERVCVETRRALHRPVEGDTFGVAINDTHLAPVSPCLLLLLHQPVDLICLINTVC